MKVLAFSAFVNSNEMVARLLFIRAIMIRQGQKCFWCFRYQDIFFASERDFGRLRPMVPVFGCKFAVLLGDFAPIG
jgi:hypothetical protein